MGVIAGPFEVTSSFAGCFTYRTTTGIQRRCRDLVFHKVSMSVLIAVVSEGVARRTESNGKVEDKAPAEHLGSVSVAAHVVSVMSVWTYAGDWLHHVGSMAGLES